MGIARGRVHLVSPLILILAILSSLSLGFADSIHGCGGFVEASSSLIKSRKSTDAKLDYSDITVELRTFDGLVRDRTQCAPNGYYFIPVYDKGVYVIKINGPEGWSWNPEEVRVVVDDSGCNGNEDINFRFTGFTLSGKILGAVGGESCIKKNHGPSGVNVDLLYPDDELISSVSTSSSGEYIFSNVIPGKYKIRASHPTLEVKTHGSTEVDLGFENGKVDDIFFVPGYDVRGYVVAQGNPMLGVYIYLHSDDVKNVHCSKNPGENPNALCHTVSDADGMFEFKSIPCGKYDLVPYYKGENTVFDISPPIMSIHVGHEHAKIFQKFQVTGFSVGGRVVDGNDNGVHGVQIVVDGIQRSVTDANGFYIIDKVAANQYTIEARKDHYRFNIMKDYMVLPNMVAISDIKAISYDVCGVVWTIDSNTKIKVALTHGPENSKPQAKLADENGKFCFEVPHGDYRLSAMATGSESYPGLVFKPPYIDISVKTPLLNIEFSQALVNVHGTVLCKEKCDPSVSITLTRMGGVNNEVKPYTMKEESNSFVFSNVSPGKYQLKVKHTVSGEDTWCWEHNAIDVNVGLEDVKDIAFVQKGFWVNIVSTHNVNAHLTSSDMASRELIIKKGSQRFCVESPGIHEIRFDSSSCVFFGSPSIKFDASNVSPLYLKGEKYLLKGQIITKFDEYNSSSYIVVNVLNSEGKVIDTTQAQLSSKSDETSYEYSIWTSIGEDLTFVPVDPRTNGDKFLFYPPTHHVKVKTDGCQANIPSFLGRKGLYLRGSVSPSLSGVDIMIIAEGNSDVTSLKKNDVVFETATADDGSFVAGPFYDDISYNINASKAGYHLKRIDGSSFTCQKLGQISVHVVGEPESSEPIPPLLLSLSSSDNYRNNSATRSGGTFAFENLFPGVYYLRPLHKEYAFAPAADAIELRSGDFKNVTFQAKRVAYSAMGSVTMLSGEPKEGVTIEARSQSKGFYEETTSDFNGTFRLRGLHPLTSYAVKIDKKDTFERSSPQSITIEVGNEDLKGLNFVVFEKPEFTLLTCHVEGDRKPPANLMVEIKSADEPSKVESVFQLPPSNFFQVKTLPRGQHVVGLRPYAKLAGFEFESDAVEVDLEKESHVHVGPLKYRFREDHRKQDATPVPVFSLIVGVSGIALFLTMSRLKDFYLSSVNSVKKEPKKSIIRKKTY